jgi:hypothetical protein
VAKKEGVGLLVVGPPEKDAAKDSDSEDTGESAMSAASSAAMSAVKRSDAKAFRAAMRELFDAFMMVGPGK